VSRAEAGQLNANGLSALLPELIDDVLGVSTNEDWLSIADALIEDAREARAARKGLEPPTVAT